MIFWTNMVNIRDRKDILEIPESVSVLYDNSKHNTFCTQWCFGRPYAVGRRVVTEEDAVQLATQQIGARGPGGAFSGTAKACSEDNGRTTGAVGGLPPQTARCQPSLKAARTVVPRIELLLEIMS